MNKNRHKDSIELQKDIAKLEAQHKATGRQTFKEELDLKISKLKLIEASCAAKSIMYARQQMFDFRDKPNKLLARILAQGHLRQSIPGVMISKTGEEVCLLGDKLKVFSEYYNDLYKSTQPDENVIQCFLSGIEIPGLAEAQQQRLNIGITITDLEAFIQSMKLGRAPGLDGLPIEFYRYLRKICYHISNR